MSDDSIIFNGPSTAALTLILAHGAGAPMDSPFMNIVAEGVANSGVRVARFEFPYMAARRTLGKRGAPDREPVLLAAWRDTAGKLGDPARLVIGGKSMGGRIATMVADELGVAGIVCFGYPFHPPGNPARTRVKHLESLRTPALFIQGTRDQFGSREDVAGYKLSSKIRFAWMEDGDHSLKPRAKSGRTEAQNLADAIEHATEFLTSLKKMTEQVPPAASPPPALNPAGGPIRTR